MALSFRKQKSGKPRMMGAGSSGSGKRGGGSGNSNISHESGVNVRTPAGSKNTGVLAPPPVDVPSYFTITATIASGTNVDYYLFDGDDVALNAVGATQGANATITMNGSANLYTSFRKVFTKEQVQVNQINYYSSTSDHKDLYVVSADFDGSYSRKPIFTLSGKSPMQTTQTYLTLDVNFILDSRTAVIVRIASSSETVRLGFKVSAAYNRIS